jgi:hypothetical protein
VGTSRGQPPALIRTWKRPIHSHPALPDTTTHQTFRASPFRPRSGTCPPSALLPGDTGKHGGPRGGRNRGGQAAQTTTTRTGSREGAPPSRGPRQRPRRPGQGRPGRAAGRGGWGARNPGRKERVASALVVRRSNELAEPPRGGQTSCRAEGARGRNIRRSAWLSAHDTAAFGDDILFPGDFLQELTLGGRLEDCRLSL